MQLIELHILQSFPVSCLNRDDVGAPKTATFGGVPRARLSSQSLKRAIRLMLQQSSPALFAAERSKLIITPISSRLERAGFEPSKALALARAVGTHLATLDEKAAAKGVEKVKTLMFLSPGELDSIAAHLAEASKAAPLLGGKSGAPTSKKKAQADTGFDVSKVVARACKDVGLKDAADVALFGRMVASDHSLTVEGAAMFGHALSTHKAENDLDFYTAVDDRQKEDPTVGEEDRTGSGMMGVLEFTSAVYYRYAAVNLGLLFDEEHLAKLAKDERRKVVDAFIHATLLAVPGARKNSMNAHTEVGYALGLYHSKGQPIQLINAYEEPLWARGGSGLLKPSVRKGLLHLKKIEEFMGDGATEKVATGTYQPNADTGETVEFTKQHIPDQLNLNDFVKRLTAHVQ